jgi:hypothetical protein
MKGYDFIVIGPSRNRKSQTIANMTPNDMSSKVNGFSSCGKIAALNWSFLMRRHMASRNVAP